MVIPHWAWCSFVLDSNVLFRANRTGNTILLMSVYFDKYSQTLNVLQSEVEDLNDIFLMLDTHFLYDESSFLLEKQFGWNYM
jgi:hypothetical protein